MSGYKLAYLIYMFFLCWFERLFSRTEPVELKSSKYSNLLSYSLAVFVFVAKTKYKQNKTLNDIKRFETYYFHPSSNFWFLLVAYSYIHILITLKFRDPIKSLLDFHY